MAKKKYVEKPRIPINFVTPNIIDKIHPYVYFIGTKNHTIAHELVMKSFRMYGVFNLCERIAEKNGINYPNLSWLSEDSIKQTQELKKGMHEHNN